MSNTLLAPTPATSNRVPRSLALRIETAGHDAFMPAPAQFDNGDEARYPDKSGTYSKGVLQAGIGLVDPAAFQTFREALDSGDPADFEKILLGGPRTQNGPQGGLAFDLQCPDTSQFRSPAAPPLASPHYAAELVELYWASLLRDVAFTDYPGHPVVAQAAAELSGLPDYQGPRDAAGKVTPDLLFRGPFAGERAGPYLSQFLLQDTSLGALPIVQKYMAFVPNIDFMTDPVTYLQVQNGQPTAASLQFAPAPLYLHDGRGLAAYTHVDVLYQAYFTAYLILDAIKAGKAALNPGNPYTGSKTQNGFVTFGDPDIAATLAAVASEALKAVWYQKWWVHLRHRPESGGALVHLNKTGQGGMVQGKLHPSVVNSQAVAASFAANNSWFLSQAFPEGSPTHPAYPTGHGAVAGACITVLKFFMDGDFIVLNPKVPSTDGTTLNAYAGPDANALTANGELNKLATNVSFGHGIHAGIHWRSDTDSSIRLGEHVALSVLRDRARTYNEKFSVTITKVDGGKATVSN